MTGVGSVFCLYWRGQGSIGSLVRHASSSQWGHVGITVDLIDDCKCYLESFPGAGFRIKPITVDNPPQGVQNTGLEWKPGMLDEVLLALSGRRYSYVNGILAAFGHRRDSKAIQCAQAAEIILRIAGLDIPRNLIPEPQGIANEVERLTGNPVKRIFEWDGRLIPYRGISRHNKQSIKTQPALQKVL